MALKNTKHELFCQYRAVGKTADEAYQLAGYKPNRHNASRLNTTETIRTRVREIQERAQKANDVTLEAMTDRFNDAVDKASNDGAHPAVMAGLFNLAKLHGLIVDKQKVEQGRLDGMSDDALAEHIERELARIAESRPEGAGDPGRGVVPQTGPEPDPDLRPVPETDGIPPEGPNR